MNKRNLQYAVLITAVLVVLGAMRAHAQSEQGQMTGCPGCPTYDPKTETTIKGTVQEVKEVPGYGMGMHQGSGTGTHLTVKTDNDVYDVHVGPTWYLTREKYAFAKGDQVEVIGSKVKYQGADSIIARQIKKDGNTWTLRNAQGVPLWSRGKNR